jgi:hypothetical protein
MTEPVDITVERIHPSGAYLLSTIYGGRYIHMQYMGYTKREALRMFRAMVKEG